MKCQLRIVRALARAGTLGTLLALGCSVVVDASREQCRRDSDCTSRGGEFSDSVCDEAQKICVATQASAAGSDAGHEGGPAYERWACREAPAAPAAPGPFQVTLHVQDIITAMPVVGTDARLCRKLDVDCTAPVVPPVATDTMGDVTFEVPANFNGYVRFDKADYLSGLYHFNPPVREDQGPTSVQLAPPAIASALTGTLGIERSEERGLILLTTRDCLGDPVSGVRYSSDHAEGDATGFYVVEGAPQATDVAPTTDATGYGGYVNAKPGYAAITATLDAEGLVIGKISLLVEANAITYSSMVPDGG